MYGCLGEQAAHDFIGSCEVALGDVVSAPGQTLNLKLRDPNKPHGRGTLFVSVEERVEVHKTCCFQLSATHLDKMDWFGKSDPFVEFLRSKEGNQHQLAYRGEVIKKTLDPTWRPFELSLQKLCNGDLDRPLKCVVYDWNSSGSHEEIGRFDFSVRELVGDGENGHKEFTVINEKKQEKKGAKYKGSGQLTMKLQLRQEHTFVEYLRGGLEINLSIGEDVRR